MKTNIGKKADAKLSLLISYSAFLFFLVWILPMTPFPDLITTEAGVALTPPACEIGGWTAILDAILCAFGYLGFFINLIVVSVGTGYEILFILVFSPLIVGIAYVLFTALRGV